MSDPTVTLILRFRDLIDPSSGHTVEKHNEIVAEYGYVWWGWWKKQSEDVPVDLWSKVKKQLRDVGGLALFLVHSGDRTVFRTTLHDLEYDNGGGETDAPEDGTKTPEYYRSYHKPSWFKIGRIEQIEEKALQGLEYTQEPHDPIAAPPAGTFTGERIHDVEELLQFGNVTYWVAQSAAASLGEAQKKRVAVRHLPPISRQKVVLSHSNRILHISDLHVGEPHHAFEVKEPDAVNKSLDQAIYDAVGDSGPGIVILTGDLTWAGTSEEFKAAVDVLENLRSKLGLTRDHFIIVPGNHDLQWHEPDGTDYDASARVSVASEPAKQNYAAFFRRWYGTQPNAWLSIGRRYFLEGGPTLEVLGLNSSELQQTRDHFAGLGRITDEAFQSSATEMGWDQGRAAQYRVLAIHHHLLPVNPVMSPSAAKGGFGVALDAESQLLKATRLTVDLVVHGHQHDPYAGFTHRTTFDQNPPPDWGLLVLGAGSCGVVDEHLGATKRRSFNLIELDTSGISATLFEQSTETTFRPAGKVYSGGRGPWKSTGAKTR